MIDRTIEINLNIKKNFNNYFYYFLTKLNYFCLEDSLFKNKNFKSNF